MGYEVKSKLKKLLADMYARQSKHLLLLVRLPSGEEHVMNVETFIKADGEVIKVLKGNDLNDLDKLLDDFRAKVKAE